MIINVDYYPIIDEEYRNYIMRRTDVKDHWLLEQTLYTGEGRRNLIKTLPIPVMGKALDLGSGFGAMAIDMAFSMPIQVYSTDAEDEMVDIAREIAEKVDRRVNYLKPGEIFFKNANIYELDFEDNTFDFVISRFLFQHLKDPAKAFSEIYRVLKPGGIVCTIDVDESFAFSYPEAPAYEALYAAFKKMQEMNGGDRQIGRKLPTLLHENNFVDIYTQVDMQSGYEYTAAENMVHRFIRERFLAARNDIVEKGIMGADEFDKWIEKLNEEVELWQFTASGQVVAFAKKMN